MKVQPELKFLFIINPGSGNNKTDWTGPIRDYFESLPHRIELFDLSDPAASQEIKEKIEEFRPQRVVAVGGDGTVKLAAKYLLQTDIPLGILPAGSANGLAKELGIPDDYGRALDILIKGELKKIHVIKINDEICIHLSDIGFNAFVIKKFEGSGGRGMWGYLKASWKVLWDRPLMQIEMQIGNKSIKRQAAMVVVANARRYGSGALINPDGKLDDDVFEVIVVKKVSIAEIFKMMVTHSAYNPRKTEVFQTGSLRMFSRVKAHFQVDGEYLGKVNNITAAIIPGALDVIC
ncbi:MAG TPA: diacylglycerol kinase family protein, partial [Puia sp.]|nr:diacylglycerol kinase family protein [Puia sp.]